MKLDTYLYGMTCLSTIHVLDGAFPPADSYREIQATHVIPSGETGNAALLLNHFGLKVKMDGPYLGSRTREPILDFYARRGLTCRHMRYDHGFPGVEDLVLVDPQTRTIFGTFGRFFSGNEQRWSPPDRKAIAAAKTVSLDPFMRLAAQVPYVTIDLPPDDFIHRHAAVTIISDEFTRREFPGADTRSHMKRYMENTDGLVIFTFGAKEILFGRRGGEIRTFAPFRVESKGSLAAGDFFRGGTVYAVHRGWPDQKIVAVSAAVGALACTNFPAALNLPSLEAVLKLAESIA
jgi:sugar/nucleoside kinase (ribokinase family)